MPRDKGFEETIAQELKSLPGLTTMVMFGGLAWMLHGNLLCAVRADGMLVRLGKGNDSWALAQPGVVSMLSIGRKMPGWVRTDALAFADDELRRQLLQAAVAFVQALPRK